MKRVLSIGVDPEEHPGVQLLITAPLGDTGFDNARLRFADLASGELIGEADPASTLTGFLLELHAQWFLGPVGELIGALIALLVLISLISGLVVYAPYVRRIVFGVLRRDRGSRLLQLDLHNFIGAVVLGWALAVTATGFLLGFGTVAIGIWQMTDLGELRAEAASLAPVNALDPPVDVDRAFAAAAASAPEGWSVTSVLFPGTEFSTPRHYTVLLAGSSGAEARLFRVAIIDAATGEVAAAPEVPLYLKAIALAEPLHFGDYGGLALKILWALLDIATIVILVSGRGSNAQAIVNACAAEGWPAQVVEAEYAVPLLTHVCMEPIAGTARATADHAELWLGTQGHDYRQVCTQIAAQKAGNRSRAGRCCSS